jgi:hypothetical protein
MTMPGFSAEVSVGKSKGSYVLSQGRAPETGKVSPQLFCLPGEGGTTCYQCWDEGGYSGCISFRVPRFTQF